MRRKPAPPPKKPHYPRVNHKEFERLQHVVKYGDELLTKAGYKVSSKVTFLGGIVPKKEVPRWMDPITILWLRRGGEIPWEQFRDAIRHGMSGNLEEVEMFLFAWEDQ